MSATLWFLLFRCCSTNRFTFSSMRTPSLVLGSVFMLKIPSSFPETISKTASQLSVFSSSTSCTLNLMTSTWAVFSIMLPEYYDETAHARKSTNELFIQGPKVCFPSTICSGRWVVRQSMELGTHTYVGKGREIKEIIRPVHIQAVALNIINIYFLALAIQQ